MMGNVPHPAEDITQLRQHNLDRQRAVVKAMGESVENLGAFTILNEKPIHRTIAYLMAAGRSRDEVAELTGISRTTIDTVVKQPWFRKMLREITDAAGKDMVKAFLEGEVIPSLEVLRTIRDDTTQKGPTRVAAASTLLDRFLGKPVAHIESSTNLNIHTAGRAAATVESELERVDAELRRLRGVTSQPANGAS